MKVLLVANVAKEHILKFHIPTIKALIDDGWTVDVACSGEEKIPYCNKQYKMKYKRNPFSYRTIRSIKQMKDILMKENYDLIYCHTPVGGLVSRIAHRLTNKKDTAIVYFAHGFHFYKGAPLRNWLIYFWIEKILALWTDAIITINEEDYQNAINLLHCQKVYKLDGMGVNLNRFNLENRIEIRETYRNQLEIPQDAWVMIYLAELIPNKNQNMLIRALKETLKVNPNTYLILAGVDHSNGRFKEYAQRIGVIKNIRFLGWRDDIEKLYACADICTASSIREGFGINIVEALASRLPVIATNNRGHATIIENGINGYLVEVNDYTNMSKRVCDILLENETVIKFDVEKYENNLIIKNILDILNCTVIERIIR